MDDARASFATKFLQRHPDVAQQVRTSESFTRWLSGFAAVEVDDETFLVVGGDMLLAEDEMILEWARRTGIVSQRQIDRERSAPDP